MAALFYYIITTYLISVMFFATFTGAYFKLHGHVEITLGVLLGSLALILLAPITVPAIIINMVIHWAGEQLETRLPKIVFRVGKKTDPYAKDREDYAKWDEQVRRTVR